MVDRADRAARRTHRGSKSPRRSIATNSTTFRAIRGERRTWRLVETLCEIDRDTDDPNDIAPDLATITVVNDWSVVHIGHHNDAERDVAQGISERFRARRTTGTGRAT